MGWLLSSGWHFLGGAFFFFFRVWGFSVGSHFSHKNGSGSTGFAFPQYLCRSVLFNPRLSGKEAGEVQVRDGFRSQWDGHFIWIPTPTPNPGRSALQRVHGRVGESRGPSGSAQKFQKGCAVPGRPDGSLRRLEGGLRALCWGLLNGLPWHTPPLI